MGKASRWWVVGAIVVFAALVGAFVVQQRQANARIASMHDETEAMKQRYGIALGAIASIQDSLNSIVLGDEAVHLDTKGLTSETSLNESEGDAVQRRISELRAGVERSKYRIDQLDRHLRASGIQIKGLEKMIASLKRSVADKEARIAVLIQRNQSLHGEVRNLTASVEEKRQELGTVYVVIGDRRALTESGVVVATGGVLGLGKSLRPSGYLDEASATVLDTDYQTEIEIPAKGAEVLTAQPSSSYAIEADGDNVRLRILDPQEFRKIRHVVILTREAA